MKVLVFMLSENRKPVDLTSLFKRINLLLVGSQSWEQRPQLGHCNYASKR